MLAAVQEFSKHMLLFMTMYYKDKGLFKNAVVFLFHNGARSGVEVQI